MFFTPQNKAEKFEKKSSDILSVFTKTIEDAKKINEKISEETVKNEQKIAELVSENEHFAAISRKNEKFISKLENFFND